jgi:hypothetical protein
MATETERRPIFSGATPTPDKTCQYCRTSVHGNAKKCPACAEWLVETALDWPSQVLRGVGFASVGLSILGALVIWYIGNQIAAAANPFSAIDSSAGSAVTSFALWLYRGWSIFVAVQGSVLGIALIAFAERGPRRPR